jgi:hypothetical protein
MDGSASADRTVTRLAQPLAHSWPNRGGASGRERTKTKKGPSLCAANYMFVGYYPKMAWDEGLVGTAREIAATDRTPLRVMAGPGTGKSFAMKRRVARLLEG